jgi:hypothetical protein
MNFRITHAGTVFIVVCSAAILALPAQSAGVRRVASQIDWVAAKKNMDAAERSERTRSGAVSPSEAKKVRLPILLVDEGEVKAAADFAHQVDSYVAHYRLKDATLAITGLVDPISLKGQRKPRRSPHAATSYQFEITEDASDLSFQRYGAFYNMRISCAIPDDVRCSKSDFLSTLADKLPVAGGNKL